jgi:hypothetical protein
VVPEFLGAMSFLKKKLKKKPKKKERKKESWGVEPPLLESPPNFFFFGGFVPWGLGVAKPPPSQTEWLTTHYGVVHPL